MDAVTASTLGIRMMPLDQNNSTLSPQSIDFEDELIDQINFKLQVIFA
jgi:hypothetical protein